MNDSFTNTLETYLASYNVPLVKLHDSPDPETGVSPVLPQGATAQGSGVDQSIYFYQPTAQQLAAPGVPSAASYSSNGLFHYPGSITNAQRATPALMFKATPPAFTTDTVAAAILTLPVNAATSNAATGLTFSQFSFYFPFSSFHTTSIAMGKVWLRWASKGAYPPPVSLAPLATYKLEPKTLIVSNPNDDVEVVINTLSTYGMPYDVFTVGANTALNLEKTPDSVGNYAIVVLTSRITRKFLFRSDTNVYFNGVAKIRQANSGGIFYLFYSFFFFFSLELPGALSTQLETYLIKYNVRLIRLR
jgi:hypothetical protein